MVRGDLIPSRGAIAEDLSLEVLRELTLDDMKRLADSPKLGVPVIQKLRSIHHTQARMLAEGKKLIDVANAVGCSTQRLVQLQNDPTFAELVIYYRDQINVVAIDRAQRMQEQILDVGEQALDELQARMDDEEKRSKMPVGEIRKLAEFAMDRTVAPPRTVNNAPTAPATVTINFGTPVGKELSTTIDAEINAFEANNSKMLEDKKEEPKVVKVGLDVGKWLDEEG